MLETIKEKFYQIFPKKKKTKPARNINDFEGLKMEFLEVKSHLSLINQSPIEKINTNVRLQYLATEIASIFGGPDWVFLLANAAKEEVSEIPKEFDTLLKGADVPTLLQEFKAVHLAMLTALRDEVGEGLNTRLKHVARELASRLGGKEFVAALNEVLQKK